MLEYAQNLAKPLIPALLSNVHIMSSQINNIITDYSAYTYLLIVVV